MSLAAHRQSVESTFQAQAAAAYPSVPVKFENVPFVQPESPWMALTLLDGKSFVCNLGRGSQVDRHVGLVQVDTLVPANSGTAQAIILAEWAGSIWRLQRVNLADNAVVRYRTPSYHNMGCQNGFHRVCMRVPYWRDEVAQ